MKIRRIRRVSMLALAIAIFAAVTLMLAAAEQDPAPERYDADDNGRTSGGEFKQAVLDYAVEDAG